MFATATLLFVLLYVLALGTAITLPTLYQYVSHWVKVFLVMRALNQAAKGSSLVQKEVDEFGKTHHEA